MGLTVYTLDYLATAAKRYDIRGRCLTLGRVDMYFGVDSVLASAEHHGFLSAKDGVVQIPPGSRLEQIMANEELLYGKNPRNLVRNGASDHVVFAALGFDSIHCVDASDFEGADFVWDLNNPGLAEHVEGQYDLVIDPGTLEHVFHMPNALANIDSVLKVGGCVLHSSPTNNSVDHGFYQFSPTLYADYYAANQYDILQIHLMQHGRTDSPSFLTDPPKLMEYSPGSLDRVSQGGLDNLMYGTLALARKTARSTSGVFPMQGTYRNVWQNIAAAPSATAASN